MNRASFTLPVTALVVSLGAVMVAQTASYAIPSDAEWEELPAPQIQSVEVNPDNPFELLVHYRGEVGPGAASEAVAFAVPEPESIVEGNGGAVSSSYTLPSAEGIIAVAPGATGTIEIQVLLKHPQENAGKYSEKTYIDFQRPLPKPQGVRVAAERASGSLVDVDLQWQPVPTATRYTMEYRIIGTAFQQSTPEDSESNQAARLNFSAEDPPTWGTIPQIPAGSEVEMRVVAHRADRSAASDLMTHIVAAERDPQPPPELPSPAPEYPQPESPDPDPDAGAASSAPVGDPQPSAAASTVQAADPHRETEHPVSRNEPGSLPGGINPPLLESAPQPHRLLPNVAPTSGFTAVPGATASNVPSADSSAIRTDDSPGPAQASGQNELAGQGETAGEGDRGGEATASENIEEPSQAGGVDPAAQGGSRIWVLLGLLTLAAMAISSAGALVRRVRGNLHP